MWAELTMSAVTLYYHTYSIRLIWLATVPFFHFLCIFSSKIIYVTIFLLQRSSRLEMQTLQVNLSYSLDDDKYFLDCLFYTTFTFIGASNADSQNNFTKYSRSKKIIFRVRQSINCLLKYIKYLAILATYFEIRYIFILCWTLPKFQLLWNWTDLVQMLYLFSILIWCIQSSSVLIYTWTHKESGLWVALGGSWRVEEAVGVWCSGNRCECFFLNLAIALVTLVTLSLSHHL